MTTDKRDRQRANRASRRAAAEIELRRRRNRSRMITYGVVAAAVVVAIIGAAVLLSDDDSGPEDTSDTAAADDSSNDPAGQGEPATEDSADTADQPGFVYGTGACPGPDAERRIDFDGPQPLCIDPDSDYVAVFDTSEGEIRVDLHTDSVPGTVNNFVTLSRWGYYDATRIFRTDPSIAIIQGGSPHTNSASDPGPGYTISDEPQFDLQDDGSLVGPYRYLPGQLVMARSAGTDSAGAQYFFTTGPEAALLDGQGVYVVFGETDAAGLAVLESIIALHTPTGALGGEPSREVTVESVTIEEV